MAPARAASVLLALAVVACGGGGSDYRTPTTPNTPNPPGGPTAPSQTNQIAVQDNSFAPTTTTVTPGTQVTWTWGANYNAHDVTFNDGSGTSGAKTTGTYARTFPTSGVYAYQCSIHGAAMAGTITVQP